MAWQNSCCSASLLSFSSLSLRETADPSRSFFLRSLLRSEGKDTFPSFPDKVSFPFRLARSSRSYHTPSSRSQRAGFWYSKSDLIILFFFAVLFLLLICISFPSPFGGGPCRPHGRNQPLFFLPLSSPTCTKSLG